MSQNVGPLILISILLVLGNAFFVAAEYALVGARRSRVQAMARRKKKSATGLLNVLEDISPYVAGTQIGITMVGIAVGSITEPFVRGLIMHLLGRSVPFTVSYLLSYLFITYFLVVIGELFPKYLAIRMPERVAVFTTWPLVWITRLLLPLVWFAQVSASLLLRPFGINPDSHRSEALPKDELLLLIRTGSTEGVIEKMQADLLARALHLDALDAKDIMIHRLDILALDVETPKEQLFSKLSGIPHSRIPVYEEDIDHLLGIVYLYDIVKHWQDDNFELRQLVRPAVAVPENLTVDKIVTTMRDSKTQLIIVMDEYGGTSGLITLEDVVEEVFGELEDQLERDRPPIQILPNGRVTARGDVRYDELVGRLGIDIEEPTTDTLATHIVNALDRIPKLGDHVACELGTLYVENMARNRITRVSLLPDPNLPMIEKDL